jgi:hypothetical protein
MTTILHEKIFQTSKQRTMKYLFSYHFNIFNIDFLDSEFLTMQAYIDRDNLEKVKKIKSEELLRRHIEFMNNAAFDRKMRDFKLRRKIRRKFVLNLFMKIRHLNRCANLNNCSHQVFDLEVFIINRTIS